MASNYPGGLDSFDTIASDKKTSDAVGGRTHRQMHNDLGDAIEAVQTELGTTPSGSYATVKARFEAIEGSTLPQVDAKGDLIVGTADNTYDNLGVGTNDTVLLAASGETKGVKWAQVPTAAIQDDAVTAAKIAANAVGSSELADNAVDTAAIADSAVVSSKIAGGVPWSIESNLLSLTKQQCTGTFHTDAGWLWSTGDLTYADETDSGPSGAEAAYVLTKTVGTGTLVITSHSLGTRPTISSLIGTEVTLVLWVKPSVDVSMYCYLQAGSTVDGPTRWCPADEWTKVVTTVTVPTGTTVGRMYASFADVPSGETIRLARITWSSGPHEADADGSGLVIVPAVVDRTVPVACGIRSTSGTWEVIEGGGHEPMNVWSVAQNSSYVTVKFRNAWAQVGSVIVSGDETLGGTYLAGASVGLGEARITIFNRSNGAVVDPSTISSEWGNLWIYGIGYAW